MPDKITTNVATIAAKMFTQISPLDRIDADLIIGWRERLMQKTGCSWETARQCILAELNKKAGVKMPPTLAEKTSPDSGRPKSNHAYPPNTIAVRGTPEEVKFVRRIIPDNRQRLTILLDWIEGR